MKKISIICIAALFLLAGCKGNSEETTSGSSDISDSAAESEAFDTRSEDSEADSDDESESSNANAFNEDDLEISYHSEVPSDDSIKPESKSKSESESESEQTNFEKQEEKISKTESSTDASEITNDEGEIELPFIPLE